MAGIYDEWLVIYKTCHHAGGAVVESRGYGGPNYLRNYGFYGNINVYNLIICKWEAFTMADNKTYAVFQTNRGDFTVELFADKAPITVENFVNLAKSGFYDGTIFHRIIADFMIQGGDPTGTGCGGSKQTIPDEFGPGLDFSEPGVLAMANAGPNTGSSQFFVTVVPTPWLQNHHSIFGKVVKDYDVVEGISRVKTDFSDKPLEDVVLNTVKIVTEA